jgi:cyanate lyase
MAETAGKMLDLPADAIMLLQFVPYKGALPTQVPTDPLIYRFYEMVLIYGTTYKVGLYKLNYNSVDP